MCNMTFNKFRESNPQNKMIVLSDEEDSSTIPSQETLSISPDIILHKPINISCLANTMSIDSDTDSDFESTPRKTNRVKVLVTQKHNKPKSHKSSPSGSRTSLKASKTNSKQCQTENITESAQKKQKIKIIRNEKVHVNLNSVDKNKTEQNSKVLVQRKTKVSKNLFESSPSTSTVQRCKEIAIQTDNEGIVENNFKMISSSVEKCKRNIEIQTVTIINQETSTTKSSSNQLLKRSHNVSVQTEKNSSSQDGNQGKESEKNNLIQIKVTPPKKLRTINEEFSLEQFINEHQDKLEAIKVNISTLLDATTSTSTETPKKLNNFIPLKTSSAVKNTKKTPMKQSTLSELYFCKTRNKPSENSASCSSSAKSTSSISPIKMNTKNKSPEKKKDLKYSQENHNRVLENVKKIVDWVFKNDSFSILFTKSETDLLKKLFNLPDKRLIVICIRLYTRQHKWYNLLHFCDELNLTYDNFNLQEVYSNLKSCFVYTDYSGETLESLFDHLSQPDIKDICNNFKILGVSRKKEMINKLLVYSKRQCTLTSLKSADQVLRDRIVQKLGICVKLETKFKDILNRIHLLYSLTNSDLEGPNDIYNLMNRMRYEHILLPKVKMDTPLIFSNRQDFLKFYEACVLKKEFYEQLDHKDINSEYLLCVEAFQRLKKLLSNKSQIECDKNKPLFLRRFTSPWVYCKVLSTASQNLGKVHPDKVCEWLKEMLRQEIYCPNSRGYWYSQLALVTKTHLKNIIGEVEFIIAGLSDKHVNEVQKHDLSIRGSKIRKGKLSQLLYDQLQYVLLPNIEIPVSRTIQANVVHNNEPGKKLKFVRNTAEGKEYSSVEETAINYYTTKDNYTHGIHCEGQLLDALFIILFYDIIFMHVENTFISEIQDKPLDLYSNDFYTNRQNKINKRLKDIRENFTINEICDFASKFYSSHTAELKSLINFDFAQEETLHIIIRCIGQKVLAAIMERFAKDYKQFHSGLPDLFLWNLRQFTSCFVEVKSENDKLSTKQMLWISYLHKFGAKVEVCHVEHIGSRSIKKRKIPKDTPE